MINDLGLAKALLHQLLKPRLHKALDSPELETAMQTFAEKARLVREAQQAFVGLPEQALALSQALGAYTGAFYLVTTEAQKASSTGTDVIASHER